MQLELSKYVNELVWITGNALCYVINVVNLILLRCYHLIASKNKKMRCVSFNRFIIILVVALVMLLKPKNWAGHMTYVPLWQPFDVSYQEPPRNSLCAALLNM